MIEISAGTLKRLWPNAPARVIQGVSSVAGRVFAKYGLASTLEVAHVMAQISHECDGGTIIRENMNYNAGRLFEIFGVGHHSAKVTQAEAQKLAHRPEAIAERVYGLGNPKKAKELGNTRPGDGWKFRGNGMLQLTGGDSHKRIGALVGFDLYNHPEQLEDPKVSFEVAVAEFVKLNCLPAANADDVVLVTRRVNGGTNGLSQRRAWLAKWKAALEDDAPPARIVSEDAPEEPRGGESDADPVDDTEPKGILAKIKHYLNIGGSGGLAALGSLYDWKVAAVFVVAGVVIFLVIYLHEHKK